MQKNLLTCNSFTEILSEWHRFGIVEFLICSFTILTPYGIGFIRFDMILPLIIGYLALRRKRHNLYVNYTPFLLLFAYTILHELLLALFLDNIPSYYINSTLLLTLLLMPTFLITKAIDFDKFVNALFIVSFVVVLGVFYHVLIILGGGEVTPIKIPLLPFVENGSRLVELGQRPKSFFLEPSNVNNFLMFPLFLSLYYRKIIVAAFIIMGILLTTSTNGIVTTSIMILVYLLSQKVGWKTWLIFLILIPVSVGMYLTSEMFEFGRNKVENTDVERNVRTINGPMLVMGMPKEHLIVGYPAPNVEDYKNKTDYITGVYLIVDEKDDSIFVSTFWAIISKFGIVGLFLFFFAHYKLFKQCKGLVIYFVPAFILMFSGGVVGMNNSMFIWTVNILSFASFERKRAVEIKMAQTTNLRISKV